MQKIKILTISIGLLLIAGSIQAGLFSDFFKGFGSFETDTVTNYLQATSTDQHGNPINSIEFLDGRDLYISANASTTGSWAFEAITGSTQCLEVDTTGLVSGSGAACGTGAGGAAAWQYDSVNDAMITTSTKGIYITASSSFQTDLRIDGNTTTTGALKVGKDLTVNNQTSTSTINIYSEAADFGGSIIKEKEDGSGCTEQWSGSDGLEYFSDVSCP